jgi:hypothetical protein
LRTGRWHVARNGRSFELSAGVVVVGATGGTIVCFERAGAGMWVETGGSGSPALGASGSGGRGSVFCRARRRAVRVAIRARNARA